MDGREKKEELEGKLIEEEAAREVTAGSSVPASVAVYARVDVTFRKGLEGSSVTTIKDGASANVQNYKKGAIELVGRSGSAMMDPGEKGSVSDAFEQ